MGEWDRCSKAVWDTNLPATEKLVLLAIARHACAQCGLAWPGNEVLQRMCGVGKTKLKETIQDLMGEGRGLLRVHAYGRGGRSCSTVYALLVGLEFPLAAPCPKCQANLARPGRAGFVRKPGAAETGRTPGRNGDGVDGGNLTETGRAGRRPGGPQSEAGGPCGPDRGAGRETGRGAGGPVLAQAAVSEALARAASGAARRQQSVNHEQPGLQEEAPTARVSSLPTTPTSVGAHLRSLGITIAVDSRLFEIPLHPGAETAADKGEAQGACQADDLALAEARDTR